MPLITYRTYKDKIALNLEIEPEIKELMKLYCEWAGINDFGYFVEEAAKYVMEKDPLWLSYLDEKRESLVELQD